MSSGINQKQVHDIKQEAVKDKLQAMDQGASSSGTDQIKSGSAAPAKKKRDRDANVELLRLLACIMVIAGHARPFMVAQDGSIMDAALMIQAFAAPAVGIFFLISGFFTPRSNSVLRTWKHCLTGIVIPALVFAFFTDLLTEWISGKAGFLESIAGTDVPHVISEIFFGTIAFDAGRLGMYMGHLWFIFSYILIMLWFPAIRVLLKHGSRKAILFFCLLSFYRLVMIDITYLVDVPFPVYLATVMPVEVLCFVLGYVIYSDREKLRRKRHILPLAGILALAVLAIMFILQHKLFSSLIPDTPDPIDLNYDRVYYLSWNSGCAVIASILISIFILSLPLRGEKLKRALSFLGGLTFPVYLIHFPLVSKLNTSGFSPWLQDRFSFLGGAGVIIYTGMLTVLLFAVSAALGLIFRTGFRYIRRRVCRKQRS